jgi:H+/Cl- antiporter ClcA
MDTQEEKPFELSPLAFEIVDALADGGRSMQTICAVLGLPFCAETFCVTYATALCIQVGLPGAETVTALHAEGVLGRIAAELIAEQSTDR